MTDIKVQVIGVVRFSVLTDDYSVHKYGAPETLRARLFDIPRLTERLRMFQALCLGTLARQSDPDFRVTILSSADLPAAILDPLQRMLAPHPQFDLFRPDPAAHYPLTREAYDRAARPGYSHRVSFRLDDDDGVSLDFVARLRHLATHLMAMQDAPTIIAFNRGFYLERLGEGENRIIDCVERAPLSVGTALVHRDDHVSNPYRYNHRAFPQHYNTFSDIGAPVFLRTIHADNVSNPDMRGIFGQMRRREVKAALRDRFGLDADQLLQL